MSEERMEHHKDRIGPMILKTANMLRRRADASVNMNELRRITGSNGWILKYLIDREDEDVYQRDIEERFSTTRSTVSRVLKGMEEKGLLVRESVPNDARLKKLVLTDEGRRLSEDAFLEMKKLDDRVELNLSEEEKKTLVKLLKKVEINLADKESCCRRNGGSL